MPSTSPALVHHSKVQDLYIIKWQACVSCTCLDCGNPTHQFQLCGSGIQPISSNSVVQVFIQVVSMDTRQPSEERRQCWADRCHLCQAPAQEVCLLGRVSGPLHAWLGTPQLCCGVWQALPQAVSGQGETPDFLTLRNLCLRCDKMGLVWLPAVTNGSCC